MNERPVQRNAVKRNFTVQVFYCLLIFTFIEVSEILQ